MGNTQSNEVSNNRNRRHSILMNHNTQPVILQNELIQPKYKKRSNSVEISPESEIQELKIQEPSRNTSPTKSPAILISPPSIQSPNRLTISNSLPSITNEQQTIDFHNQLNPIPEAVVSRNLTLPNNSQKQRKVKPTLAERRSRSNSVTLKNIVVHTDTRANSLNVLENVLSPSNSSFQGRGFRNNVPLRLDTSKIVAIASQATPDFTPLSANSTENVNSIMEICKRLYVSNYLPIWYSPWIKNTDPMDLRKVVNGYFKTIKDMESERLNIHDSIFKTRIANSTKNSKLNRYPDIVPFDYNRVVLSSKNSDYINASYLKSLGNGKTYIAAQGPTPETFGDFWQMIWEQSTAVIVMLTKEEEYGRIKCHRYWPNSVGDTKRCHKYIDNNSICFKIFYSEDFEVMNGSTIIREFVVKREMLLRDSPIALPEPPEIRRIRMIQYLHWEDHHSTDPRSLLSLIDVTNEVNRQAIEDTMILSASDTNFFKVGPMVIHCSAGVGRTGCFCTVDSIMDQLKQKLDLSNLIESGKEIFNHQQWDKLPGNDLISLAINNYRVQRIGTVQSLSQFQLCYDAIALCISDAYHEKKPITWDLLLYDDELKDSRRSRFSFSFVNG
ncbi:protein-tyrosine phosphatase-like protein [Globomyces pollinis-pini]|nr:protein-tyrosine phosphatase-like protein [Globomyces pollinis-pini]